MPVESLPQTTPDSPPDLTSSKSSKSGSSFRSSYLSESAEPENLSHFEDIALADNGRDSYDSPLQHVGAKPVPKRPSAPPARSPPNNGAYPAHPQRERPNAMKSRPYPSLQGQVNGVLQGRPNGQGMRRGFTSPSSPALATMSARSRGSRSPSPNNQLMGNGYSASPRSASRNLTIGQSKSSRRQSWQPGRKTVKELEAEYHDSDEDVPEDAVIWNVPISPRPPVHDASTPPSPRRKSSQASLRSQASTNAITHHASAPNATSPQVAQRPSMPHSATVGAFPQDALAYQPRNRSWTNDLSDEVRELTAVLEAHTSSLSVDKSNGTSSASPSAPPSPPRPSISKLRTKTSIMELPPLQKGNIMIDPLPCSKEKEAMLSRTRPSWLPPKCPKEEKRHLKEWERMMALSAAAEARRAAKERDEEEERKERESRVERIWEQHVLPNWDTTVREPRTRELWWRGVTGRMRGQVWSKAIGNELSLSEASYAAALGRAKKLQNEIKGMGPEEQEKRQENAWFAAIERDAPAVSPELGIFKSQGPLNAPLKDVLAAYAMYRSDVGYVYGTHLIAGLLVLNMQPADAFVALANLLNRPLALGFLVGDENAMSRAYEMVKSILSQKFPKLHKHLTDAKLGLRDQEWLAPMLQTLFCERMQLDTVSRIWDLYVFEEDRALIRTAVGALGILESKLYGSREEVLAILGWNAQKWDLGADDAVMAAVREAGKVKAADGR